jgi:lantibiotic modifying enzyme
LENALADLDRRGCMTGAPGGVETPGLMVGLAGIGHGLLRFVAPDRVPCVLTGSTVLDVA